MQNTIKLSNEELELIKSQRAEQKRIADAEKNKFINKTKRNNLESVQARTQSIENFKEQKERERAFMEKFYVDSEKQNIITDYDKVEVPCTKSFECSYYSFICEGYEKAVNILKSDEAKEIYARLESDTDELDRYCSEAMLVRENENIRDYGFKIVLEPIVVDYVELEFHHVHKVPVGTNEVSAFKISYLDDYYTRRKGVQVKVANYQYFWKYEFKTSDRTYSDNRIYTRLNTIRKKVDEMLSMIDQRIEQDNKARLDREYTDKKFAEFVANETEVDSYCSDSLEITYNNGTKLQLAHLSIDPERKRLEFDLSFNRIRLPQSYEVKMNQEQLREFLNTMKNLNFNTEE